MLHQIYNFITYLAATCGGVWPLPPNNPQHPFVPWVSPLPLILLKLRIRCNVTKTHTRNKVQNSPIAVLAISVR